VKLRRHP
jgi:hypothetical protein